MKLSITVPQASHTPIKFGSLSSEYDVSSGGSFGELMAETSEIGPPLENMGQNLGNPLNRETGIFDPDVSEFSMDGFETIGHITMTHSPAVTASQAGFPHPPSIAGSDVASVAVTNLVESKNSGSDGADTLPNYDLKRSPLSLNTTSSVAQMVSSYGALQQASQSMVTSLEVDVQAAKAINAPNDNGSLSDAGVNAANDGLKVSPKVPGVEAVTRESGAVPDGVRRAYEAKNLQVNANLQHDMQTQGVKIENVSIVKPTGSHVAQLTSQIPVFATLAPHDVASFIARASEPQLSSGIAVRSGATNSVLPASKQTTSIELQLVPRSLGVVDVKISTNTPGQLNIEIIARTSEAENVMRGEMNNIKEALRAIGISLDELRLSVQQQSSQEPGQSRSSGYDGFSPSQRGFDEQGSSRPDGQNSRLESAKEHGYQGSEVSEDDGLQGGNIRSGLYL